MDESEVRAKWGRHVAAVQAEGKWRRSRAGAQQRDQQQREWQREPRRTISHPYCAG